jgi:hypothetical protein
MCPFVVASGHDQGAPDEADFMGYRVAGIRKADLEDVGGGKRSRLQVDCRIAGGWDLDEEAFGRIPALAYRVSALGRLAPDFALDVGKTGVFFGHPDF